MATYSEPRKVETLTIVSGEALTPALEMRGMMPVGVVMPAAWTEAALTFQMSADGTTYVEVYAAQTGAAYSETAAASIYIPFDLETLIGCRWLKIRSGTSGTPVNQTREGGTTLTVIVRPM